MRVLERRAIVGGAFGLRPGIVESNEKLKCLTRLSVEFDESLRDEELLQ